MPKISYKYEQPVAVLEQPELQETTKSLLENGYGGYDSHTRTLSPLKFGLDDFNSEESSIYGYQIFDSVTAALEAGLLDEKIWPSELFADATSYAAFVETLRTYEDYYKLTDPWWQAFRALLDATNLDEADYTTAAKLAEQFEERLEQLPAQWV